MKKNGRKYVLPGIAFACGLSVAALWAQPTAALTAATTNGDPISPTKVLHNKTACVVEFAEEAQGVAAQRQRYLLPLDKPWTLFSRVDFGCLTSQVSTSSILASDGKQLFRLIDPLSIPELQGSFPWWFSAEPTQGLLLANPDASFEWLVKSLDGAHYTGTRPAASRITPFTSKSTFGIWTSKLSCDKVTHLLLYPGERCDWTIYRTGAAWDANSSADRSATVPTKQIADTVVKVEFVENGRRVVPCTGIMIAPDRVLTAGHCATSIADCQSPTDGRDCGSYSVDVERSGKTSSVPVLQSFARLPRQRLDVEYALLQLFPSPWLARSHAIAAAPYGVILPTLGSRNTAAIAGFPEGRGLSEFHDCEIFFDDTSLLYHTCRSRPGMSGGPVWARAVSDAGNIPFPLGIHTAPATIDCEDSTSRDIAWWKDVPLDVRAGLGERDCGDRRCVGVAVKLRAVFADYCENLQVSQIPASPICNGLLRFMSPVELPKAGSDK